MLVLHQEVQQKYKRVHNMTNMYYNLNPYEKVYDSTSGLEQMLRVALCSVDSIIPLRIYTKLERTTYDGYAYEAYKNNTLVFTAIEYTSWRYHWGCEPDPATFVDCYHTKINGRTFYSDENFVKAVRNRGELFEKQKIERARAADAANALAFLRGA